MSEQSVDLLIIGDGVSARAMQWELFLSNFPGSVLQVYSNELFPMTSLKSTGVVAFHGMRTGTSPLGDVLTNGVDYFFKNIKNCGLMGLENATLIDTCIAPDDRLIRRYDREEKLTQKELGLELKCDGVNFAREEAVFINPTLFMDSLLNQYNYDSNVDTLTSVSDNVATFLSGKKIKFGKIILATGIGLAHLNGLDIEYNKKIMEVSGSFYQWDIDLKEKSFALGLERCNLVYRSSDNVLMLGGTTQKDHIISHDGAELGEFYDEMSELVGSWFPAPEEARVLSGVRVKGPRRMPQFEEISKDIFILGAAYKNGWSQSFYGASKIVQKLL